MRKGQIVAALKKRMAQLEAQAKQHKSRMTMRRAFCKVQANKNLLVQGESGAAQHRNMHGTVVGSQAARGSRNVAQDMYRGKLTHSEFAPERAACGRGVRRIAALAE